MVDNGKLESVLAKRLAGNDKKTRDKAIRKLKQWLAARSKSQKSLGDASMLRIWKGLFYCMWMSDKPLVQEELAHTIGDLIHCFGNTQASIEFINAAFQTVSREWNGIDRLRMDKFMMLVRQVLRSSLVFLKNNEWSDELTSQFCEACQRNVASSDVSLYVPLGLMYHFADIYCEEIAKVGGEQLEHDQIMLLLEPFLRLLLLRNEWLTCRVIVEKVFHYFLRQFGMAEENEMDMVGTGTADDDDSEEEDAAEGSDDEMTRLSDDENNLPLMDREIPLDPRAGRVDVTLPVLQIDLQKLADEIFKRARNPVVKGKNRALSYKLVKLIKRAVLKLEGELPIKQVRPVKKRRKRTKADRHMENEALYDLHYLNERLEEEREQEEGENMSEGEDLKPEKVVKRKKKNMKNRKDAPIRREKKQKVERGKKMQKKTKLQKKTKRKPKSTGFKAQKKS